MAPFLTQSVSAQATLAGNDENFSYEVTASGYVNIGQVDGGTLFNAGGSEIIATEGQLTVDGVVSRVAGLSHITIVDSFLALRVMADGGVLVTEVSHVAALEASIAAGEVWKANDLALEYFEGGDLPKDDARGEELLRIAADGGNDVAQTNLAWRLLGGYGMAADAVEARHYADLATHQGNTRAMAILGDMRARGIGGPADPESGVSLLEEAIEAGYERANLTLGALYGNGTGVAVDNARAAELFRLALAVDPAEAARNLAIIAAKTGATVVSYEEGAAMLEFSLASGMPATDIDPVRADLAAARAAALTPPPVPDTTPEAAIYFYVAAGASVGPMPLSQIRALVTDGTIRPATLVWEPAMTDWTPASQVDVLNN